MQHPFPHLSELIDKQLPHLSLTVEERQMIAIANKINSLINDDYKILSENLPSQKESNDAKTNMLVVQREVDAISKLEISLLDKIQKSAEVVKKLGVGNDQQKTFLAFKLAIDLFKHELLSTIHHTCSLRIQCLNSTVSHYYLVLNDSVVCDPWLQLVYPAILLPAISESEPDIFSGKVRDYFYLDQGWNCFRADTPSMLSLVYDFQSTQATFRYAPQHISAASSAYSLFQVPEESAAFVIPSPESKSGFGLFGKGH